MSENSKSKVGFLTAFQVAAVWFGAHVGGGFATGNQTMNFLLNMVGILYGYLQL